MVGFFFSRGRYMLSKLLFMVGRISVRVRIEIGLGKIVAPPNWY